jgi:hypothetical protein
MKDEGNVTPIRDLSVEKVIAMSSIEREQPCAVVGTPLELDDGNSKPASDIASGRVLQIRDDEPLRRQIGEIELELLGAVRRIERRAHSCRADGKKSAGSVGAVWNDESDYIAALKSEVTEAGSGSLHM